MDAGKGKGVLDCSSERLFSKGFPALLFTTVRECLHKANVMN